jgi:cell division protein FtsQ
MTATLSQSSVRRFRAAARRRRWRRNRVLLVALVVATVLGGLSYVALGTDLLAVRRVQVTGNHQNSAQTVGAAADVPVGTSMVLLDRAAVQRRVLAALPDVASVDVVRSWPASVRLVIRERVAVAVTSGVGRFVLVDRGGVPFRSVTVPPAGLPAIEVPHPGPGDPTMRAALAVLRGLPADLRRLTLAVAAATAAQVILRLHGGREVMWGDADDGPAKAAVVRVLLKRPGRHIDVSSPGLVTIR